jgi:phosphoglycolate phosphatase-like HAD superfamily hydrolase
MSNLDIVILDFDDTLFPTTQVQKAPSFLAYKLQFQKELDLFYSLIVFVLQRLKRNYRVYIVTNGTESWIDHATRWIFDHNFLQSILVLSAREKYEAQYPNNTVLWKQKTFLDIIYENMLHQIRIDRLLVIGDSLAEIQAGLYLQKTFNTMHVNMVHLMAAPTLKQMIEEWQLIDSNLNRLMVENLLIPWNIRHSSESLISYPN